MKRGSGNGGGYYGTGIPKKEIENLNKKAHEK